MSLRKFLRDKPTTLLMIAGFAIASFILLNVSNLVGKIMAESDAQGTYAYTAEIVIRTQDGSVIAGETLDGVIRSLQGIGDANIYLGGFAVFINGADVPHFCEILIKSNEDCKLFDGRGERIDISSGGSGGVLLGEAVYKHLGEKYGEGSRFYVEDTAYEVMDVLRNDNSSGRDETVLFVWDRAGDTGKEALKKAMLEQSPHYSPSWWQVVVIIRSNAPIDGVYDSIVGALGGGFGLATELADAESAWNYNNVMYIYFNSLYNGAALVFAVLTVYSVSGLWIAKRKREFVIRKAYGYTKPAMFRLLFSDASAIAAASFAAAVALQAAYCLISGETFDVTSYFLAKCGVVVAGMLLIVLLMLRRALKTIDRFSVVHGLKSEGRG